MRYPAGIGVNRVTDWWEANALTIKLYLLTLRAIVDVLSGQLACYVFFLKKNRCQ